MKRVFYVAFGATVGVLAVRRIGQAAQRWTPQELSQQAGGVGDRIARWWETVQVAAAQREAELRDALGIEESPGSSAA